MSKLNEALLASFCSNSSHVGYIWIENQTCKKKWSYESIWQAIQCVMKLLHTKLNGAVLDLLDPFRIAIIDSGEYLPIIEIAVLLSGMVIIPLKSTDPRISFQLSDVQPKLLLFASESTSLNPFLIPPSYTLIRAQEVKKSIAAPPEEELKLPALNDHHLSHIIYTSGSTGQPKGCMMEHGSLYHYCTQKNKYHAIQSTSISLIGSSHIFDPSLGDVCASWIAGACIAMAPESILFSALAPCLILSRSTHLLTTPSMFSTIDESPLAFPDLQTVALGGEPTPKKILLAWAPHVHLLNTYGITECCVYQSVYKLTSNDNTKVIGKPFEGITMKLLSPTEENPMQALYHPQTKGEIWICGISVGRGYLNKEELTKIHFFKHPEFGRCFRTGDIGSLQKDGNLLLKGRKDWQVKIRGNRVELTEIENSLLLACQGFLLHMVCVVQRGKLLAWCVPKREPSEELFMVLRDILTFVAAQRLPMHMVPRFLFLEEIPFTSSGKYDRFSLQKGFDVSLSDCAPLQPLETKMECLVGEIWSQELGFTIHSRTIHFFQAGGDSLASLRVCRILANKLSHEGKEDNSTTSYDDFGLSLGHFVPAELGERPVLQDYARFISEQYNTDQVEEKCDKQQNVIANGSFHATLHSAVTLGFPELLQFLLKEVTELSVFDLGSLLRISCQHGNTEVAMLLLESGASANAASPNGIVPLHLAVQSNSIPMVKILVQYKAFLHCLDSNRQNVLHFAARSGASGAMMEWIFEKWISDKNVQRVFGKGNCLNLKDSWNRTALHWASVNGHRNVVQFLLLHGADKKIVDNNQETALEIAERRARCGAQERDPNLRPSVFADIATLLGGSGDTKSVNKYKKH